MTSRLMLNLQKRASPIDPATTIYTTTFFADRLMLGGMLRAQTDTNDIILDTSTGHDMVRA